ncbi:hypothetical protein A4G19_06865 [Pasteurellaceae bacterium Macca]|nr:hypothetical protein [Pasteurellaceae bacterium Macca]
MNKNRYKLIFSQVKQCLIPVAENIKSAFGNSVSESEKQLSSASSEEPSYSFSPLSTLIKSQCNPITSKTVLKWKNVSIILLTSLSLSPFIYAENNSQFPPGLQALSGDRLNQIKVDETSKNKPSVYETKQNHVVIVDIAKPEHHGISDNRFEKFSVENGAVFNNHAKNGKIENPNDKSALVGHLSANPHLNHQKDEAKAILTQVTGSEMSKLKGGLEVFGKKADLIIVNQNGITLNGVKTYNSDRLTVATSKPVKVNQSGEIQFDVEKNKVVIDVNGVATDGLKYLDVVAKSIEQKGAITASEKSRNRHNPETQITLVAGKNKSKLKVNEPHSELMVDTASGTKSNEIAILGTTAGAMHGKNIQLVVTDSGAGVKHDGVILSENDIKFDVNQGLLNLGGETSKNNTLSGKITAKKSLTISNAKQTTISGDIKAENIHIKSGITELKNTASLTATHKDTSEKARENNKGLVIEGKRLNIQKDAKVVSSLATFRQKENINIGADAKVFSKNLDIQTHKLENKGYLQSESKLHLDTDSLKNSKLIHAKDDLKISTRGVRKRNNSNTDSTAVIENNGYENSGTIHSDKKAEIIFKDKSDFISSKHKLPTAKEQLTVKAHNAFIAKNSGNSTRNEVQAEGNLTIIAQHNVLNEGILTSGKVLNITAKNGSITNAEGAFLGGKSALNLRAYEEIINDKNAVLHSEGGANLFGIGRVYNLGIISTKKPLNVTSLSFINDAVLTGKPQKEKKGNQGISKSYIASHGWHNNYYGLNVNLDEISSGDVRVKHQGIIRAEGGLNFNGLSETQKGNLYNHGILNVKGTFSTKNVDKVENETRHISLDLYNEFFNQPADISFYYEPKARFILSPLFRQEKRQFNSLTQLFDALFGGNTILQAGIYHADNQQVKDLLHDIQSPTFKKAMGLAFGADWTNWDFKRLANRWHEFKHRHAQEYQQKQDKNFVYLPQEQAKILADEIIGSVGFLKNGTFNEEAGKEKIHIGKYEVGLQQITFKPEVSEVGKESGIDLSIILELLETPNLFIDSNVQLEKFEEIEALTLSEEEKQILAKKDEITQQNHKLKQNIEEKQKDILKKESQENAKKGELTSIEKDLDWVIKNKKILLDKSDKYKGIRNKLISIRSTLLEKYQITNQENNKELSTNQLLQKLEETLKTKKQALDQAKQKLAEEKQQILQEKDALVQEKQHIEDDQAHISQIEKKQENIEKQSDRIKQQFDAQDKKYQEEYAGKLEEITRQKKAIDRTTQRREEKAQEEINQAKEQIHQQSKAFEAQEEQNAQEKAQEQAFEGLADRENPPQSQPQNHSNKPDLNQEIQTEQNIQQENQKVAEYQRELVEIERKQAELARKRVLTAIDETRPKVDLDPLYRTRIKYINQNDYFGATYFFNRIAPKAQIDNKKQLNAIGDNYFEHQLITRTIEKKVDNHLALKYQLSGTELVKKLMDNAYFEAQDLNLTLGEALTPEQQAKLTQDIVWYVKTRINGKEVYVPQLYLAQETIDTAEKYKGLGSAVLKARKINVKAKDIRNSGTIAGDKVDLEADNKLKNRGSILATDSARLKGHKGIESESRSYVDENGDIQIQKSEIGAEQHLHLETDLDSDIDLTASNVSAKTAFVKTQNLNVKDAQTYERRGERGAIDSQLGLNLGIGEYEKETKKSSSLGSDLNIGHLHLAVKKDVNQTGSKIQADRVTGVVQGNYNTKAGKNIEQKTKEERLTQFVASASGSAGGKTAGVSTSQRDGTQTSVASSDDTGVKVKIGLSIQHKKENEERLTHSNSQLDVGSGQLHILGKADIGGVDINTQLPESEQPEQKAERSETLPSKEKSAEKGQEQAVEKNQQFAPAFKTLDEEEIEALMAEKGEAFFKEEAEKQQKEKQAGKHFTLSAQEIASTKQKDEYSYSSESANFSLGVGAEGHSSIADYISHKAKQIADAQRGVKQDSTVVLQELADGANLITGDAAGGSVKVSVEAETRKEQIERKSDNKTKIGGNLELAAREGSIDLNNVERTGNDPLKLRAKKDVNIRSGESTETKREESRRIRFSQGLTSSCGALSGGCSVGGTIGVDGSHSKTEESSKTHQNSTLGDNLTIETGGDLNLEGANIGGEGAKKLHLNVGGKTNITSQQDSYEKKVEGYDYSATVGASIATDLTIKPSVSAGGGTRKRKRVAKQ